MKTRFTNGTFVVIRYLSPLAGCLLLFCQAAPAFSEKAPAPGHTITGVKSGREGKNLVITILSDGPLSHEESMLSSPPRLVLDFPNSDQKVPFSTLTINDAKVKKLRIRQYQSSPETMTARSATSIPGIHGWLTTSSNAASTS